MEKKHGNKTGLIKFVAAELRQRGWQTFDEKHDSANGPDLTIAKNGISFRVEVKAVIKGKRSLTSKPVQSKAKQMCDVVALVFPNDTIVLQPMSEHLKLCSPTGSRGLTALSRLL